MRDNHLLNRKFYHNLLRWKESANRKPLIIRGARQVGKSTVVTQFSQEYEQYIALNLEKNAHLRYFEQTDEVGQFWDFLCLKFGIAPSGKSTLLFIDEIQESPKAIKLLRYFHEELPEIHIIAAGSLLEFALKDVPSFPVGRVEQLVLHPLDFEEFLMALNDEAALKELRNVPFNRDAYKVLDHLFTDYTIAGGMPEAVRVYVEDKMFSILATVYESLIQGYRDDLEKYAKNQTEKRVLRHVLQHAHLEKDRISFEGFAKSNYKSREVGEALKALDMSRVIQLIYPTTQLRPPIVDDFKKRPRLQFIDTGLLNYMLNSQADMLVIRELDQFHHGKIVMHHVVQEIRSQITNPSYKPNFWVREKTNSSAEVDMVIPYQNMLIPIEVKSGAYGKLKSLQLFMDECPHHYAIRFLGNNFSVDEVKSRNGKKYFLMNMPYFLAGKIFHYLDWFTQHY